MAVLDHPREAGVNVVHGLTPSTKALGGLPRGEARDGGFQLMGTGVVTTNQYSDIHAMLHRVPAMPLLHGVVELLVPPHQSCSLEKTLGTRGLTR